MEENNKEYNKKEVAALAIKKWKAKVYKAIKNWEKIQENQVTETRKIPDENDIEILAIKLEEKYLNDYQKENSRKIQEHLKNTKLPLSLEKVLKQQERNSKDNTQPLPEKKLTAKEKGEKIANLLVSSLNNPANHRRDI